MRTCIHFSVISLASVNALEKDYYQLNSTKIIRGRNSQGHVKKDALLACFLLV